MYRLGVISSLSGGNLIVNGAESGSTATYFTALTAGDEVVLNEETRIVDTVTNNGKFSVTVAFTSGVSGDYLYSVSRCVQLKYKIEKVQYAIDNFDLALMGVEAAKNATDSLQFNYQNTPLVELLKLRASYEQQLTKCEADANGTDIWIVPRYEYGI